ncbi:MAG: carboxy-S-adenosyl-L-methionine synthase CmoA [endosymbiont of Galathealinum brachiosum]|uniref:Carboxy-S-adenosyl-L-methionine synthase n=1 Tax=endosymbiont of Galathealinum brachiosum TaxID=2200906 RepID=A0A370DBU7_9GAMM|nr:MAG: carboxy-S-adenosyl-L-methionine synthase CmoA [endosymbiont of Galathealinum brachiosum]
MKKNNENNGKHSNDLDTLYSQPREAITGFVFDDSVVKVFEDMIGRSVPGYTTLLSMFPVLARSFVTQNSRCYDLGCSLGAATLAIQQGIDNDNVEIIAVDNSSAMVEKCEALMINHESNVKVSVQQADICEIELSSASFVVMNFTLQFIPEKLRNILIKKIYSGLNKGGAFVLSEKIKFNNTVEQDRLTTLHHLFKKANGYSDLEISQKRSALDNVLMAETVEQHLSRLRQAGFSEVIVWFQCFNFVSFLAIK